MKTKNNITIYIIVFLSIFLFELPIFARSKISYRQMCFSQQKILQYAIEMYNMDNKTQIDKFYPGREFENIEEVLLKNRYLRNEIELPTIECSYGYLPASGTSVLFCKNHGTIESEYIRTDVKIIPEYDHSKETQFSESYYQKQKQRLDKIESKRRWAIFIQEYLGNPFILFPLCILFGFILSIITGEFKLIYINDGKAGLNFQFFNDKKKMDEYVTELKENNDTTDIL